MNRARIASAIVEDLEEVSTRAVRGAAHTALGAAGDITDHMGVDALAEAGGPSDMVLIRRTPSASITDEPGRKRVKSEQENLENRPINKLPP